MRILHTNMLRGWGGQSNRILAESLAVARRGHEVALALPRGCELARRAREAGLPVDDGFEFRGPSRPVSFQRDIRRLRKMLRAETFDILHVHGSPDTWAAAFATRGVEPGPAVIRTRHNVFPIGRHPLNAWLYGQNVDGVIVISRAIEAQCAEIPFLASKPTALIWSVPDLARFRPGDAETRARVRRELETPDDAPVVLCSGRMRPEKGQDVLIRATAELRKQLPEARVWLAGDGSHKGEYEALARRLGVAKSTRLLGFRTDAPDLMAAADAAAVPSRSEGLGTAALEAMACGLAVVASDVGGLPDSVEDGKTGLLVPVEEPGALASALARVLSDGPLRRRLGRAALERIHEHFTEEALARGTVDFYSRFATGNRRPRKIK